MNLWEPYKPDNIYDPYPMYKSLRKQAPVHQAANGDFIITKYDDVKQILSSSNFMTGVRLEWIKNHQQELNGLNIDLQTLDEAMTAFLLFINPPDHTRIRSFITEIWQDRAIEEIIKRNVQKVLKQCPPEFDFMDKVAGPLPLMNIAAILGVNSEDALKIKSQTDVFFKLLDVYISIGSLKKIIAATRDIMLVLKNVINSKKQKPDDTLISRIVQHGKGINPPLSEVETVSLCLLLLAGGKETTSGLLGNGLKILLDRPEVIFDLRKNPELWPGAIDEILRYDPPAQLSVRYCTEEYNLNGHQIPAGSNVVLCIGSANRDEEKFVNPDTFDMNRAKNPHLSFGGGKHYCLGDWLGKLQTQMLLRTFVEKFSTITLAGNPGYNNNLTIRTLKTLPVRVRS